MSALATSQRTDEPEQAHPCRRRTQVETGAVRLSQGKNCLGCLGCTLCQEHQIACRSWEMQVLSQQSWGATGLCIFNSSQVMLVARSVADLNSKVFLKSLSVPEFFTLPATEAKAYETKIKDNGPEPLYSSVCIWHLAQHLRHLVIQ